MTKHKLIGYVNTRDLKTVTDRDAKSLDIINIAFAHVVDGKIVWKAEDAKEQMARLKGINPDLKFVISIGGWSAGGFSEAAYTEEGRKLFSDTAIALLKEYSLDGIDLDWEYPSYTVAGIGGCPEDKQNFTLLLKQIREDLNVLEGGERFLLTIAVGGGSFYLKGVEIDKVEPYLNYIQLMTYDLRGGFQVLTGHHTNLYPAALDLFAGSTDEAVHDFMAAGIPAEKLVIGIAFYSRMWKGVPNVDNGFIQMAETVGTYGPSYGDLAVNYINKNGFVRHWDDVAKAPYLFNGDTFISYDDEESIMHKMKYMNEKGLYGAMYWEYGTDETYTLTSYMREQINQL